MMNRCHLEDLVDLNFEHGLPNRGTVFCANTPLIYNSPQPVGLSDIDVEVLRLRGHKALWSFKVTKELIGYASLPETTTQTFSHEYNILHSYKAKHDFIANVFSPLPDSMTDTDKRFSTMFPMMDDGYDNLTPDLIEIIRTVYVIMEFTTSEITNLNVLKNLWKSKMTKYQDAVYNRRGDDKSIMYCVILVSPNHILSSCPLNDSMKLALSYRFSLSIKIESAMRQHQLYTDPESKEEDSLTNAILSKFKSITIPEAHQSGIDREYIFMLKNRTEDQTYIANTFTHGFLQAMKGNNEDRQTQINDEFLDKLMSRYYPENPRMDNKKPVQIPLIIPSAKRGIDIEMKMIPEKVRDTASQKLFVKAYEDRCKNESWVDEDPEKFMGTNVEDLEELINDNKKLRNKWHRVLLKGLDDDLMAELNESGYQAKKLKYESNIEAHRKKSQKPFSIKADTSDIDEFLAHTPVNVNNENLTSDMDHTVRLLKRSETIMETSHMYINEIEKLMKTDIYISLKVVSLIAVELAISINQNVKRDMFILKKIRGYDVELLVHPTKSSSHIFFTIKYGVGSVVLRGPFACVYEKNGEYYSNLLSVNKNRLQNWISIPFIWLNSMIHWSQRYGYPPLRLSDSMNDANLCKMTNLTVLLALEDRPRTEQIISETRYAILELAKSKDDFAPADLSNKAAKFPTILRSRLQVWLVKKIISGLREMNLNKPICLGYNDEDKDVMMTDKNGDNWRGFINFFTGEEVRSFEIMIDIMYLGYVCNKERTSETATGLDLVGKIVQETINYSQEDDIYCSGLADPPLMNNEGEPRLPKEHEWSPSYIKQSCLIFSSRMEEKLGSDWKDKVQISILKEVQNRASSLNLATLKASTVLPQVPCRAKTMEQKKQTSCGPNKQFKQTGKGGNTIKRRGHISVENTDAQDKMVIEDAVKSGDSVSRKCIEEVVRLLPTLGLIPALVIDEVIEIVESDHGGVTCRLFAKNQHAGIREIYVLTMPSRILQIICECAARVLCSFFPEETLTNPHNKMLLIDEHFKTIFDAGINSPQDMTIMNRYSSEDKTRWNQRIDVRSFILITLELMPFDLQPVLIRLLMLWKSKKIYLPEDLQDSLLKRVKRDDDLYELIKRSFHKELREDDDDICETLFDRPQSAFLNVTMGMWQGILHVYSSLLHVLQTIHYKSMFNNCIYPMLKQRGCSKALITTLVSSDDSLTLISCLMPEQSDEDDTNTVDFILTSFCKYGKYHCRYFNMTDSAKSVLATRNVFEYNSTFVLSSCVLNPQLKFVYASVPSVESESLKHRQEICHNSIKDLVENGVSTLQSHYHQIVQGLAYYSALGSLVSSKFCDWSDLILKCPEPSLGFFLLSDSISTGLMPFKYDYYRLLSNKVLPVLMGLPIQAQAGVFIPVTSQYLITHGSRARWKRLQKEVCESDWLDKMDKNKILFFGARPKTDEELRLILSMKASSTGVYESLRGSGRMVAMFQSSVYILTSPCMTIMKTDYAQAEEEFQKTKKKDSLIEITKNHMEFALKFDRMDMKTAGEHFRENPEHEVSCTSANDDLMNVLFPSRSFYNAVLTEINTLKRTHDLQECCKYRKKKNIISMRHDLLKLMASPIKVLREKWFGRERLSKTTLSTSFEKLQSIFPWISDDLDETIRNSPFSNCMELTSFLKSLEEKTSTIAPISKPIRSHTPVLAIRECVKYNPWPGYRFAANFPRTDSEFGLVKPGSIMKQMGVNMERLEMQTTTEVFKNIVDLTLMVPFSDDKKLSIIREQGEIDEIEDFELIESMETSRIDNVVKMCIFLLYINGMVPDSELIRRIINIRGGYAPIYLKRQKYNKKEMKYEGWCVIRLHLMSRECVDLIFTDKGLNCVIATSLRALTGNESIIETVCKDNSVHNTRTGQLPMKLRPYLEETVEQKIRYDMREFKEFKDSRLSCPVYFRTKLLDNISYEVESYGQLSLEVSGDCLQLRVIQPSDPSQGVIGNVNTLINYKCNVRGGAMADTEEEPSKLDKADMPTDFESADDFETLLTNWIYFRRCHQDNLAMFIKLLHDKMTKTESHSTELIKLKEWCKHTLLARLKNHGIVETKDTLEEYIEQIQKEELTVTEEGKKLFKSIIQDAMVLAKMDTDSILRGITIDDLDILGDEKSCGSVRTSNSSESSEEIAEYSTFLPNRMEVDKLSVTQDEENIMDEEAKGLVSLKGRSWADIFEDEYSVQGEAFQKDMRSMYKKLNVDNLYKFSDDIHEMIKKKTTSIKRDRDRAGVCLSDEDVRMHMGVIKPVESYRNLRSARATSVFIHHPFWDPLIMHYSRANLWDAVLNNEPLPSGFVGFYTTLSWLFRTSSSSPIKVIEDLFEAPDISSHIEYPSLTSNINVDDDILSPGDANIDAGNQITHETSGSSRYKGQLKRGNRIRQKRMLDKLKSATEDINISEEHEKRMLTARSYMRDPDWKLKTTVSEEGAIMGSTIMPTSTGAIPKTTKLKRRPHAVALSPTTETKSVRALRQITERYDIELKPENPRRSLSIIRERSFVKTESNTEEEN